MDEIVINNDLGFLRSYLWKKLPSGEKVYIGEITNRVALNNVRLQIKAKQLDNYFIQWKNFEIKILSDGKLDYWPEGFYDQEVIQMADLLK